MKRIFSAGGIVIRFTSTNLSASAQDKLSDQKHVEVLVTQHSGHHGWDFPKGHIEEGESSKDAAIREVEEETGVKAEIIEKVGETKYFYYEGKEKVFKTVIFFLMRYVSEGKATTTFEVSAMEWLPVDEVEDKLTFNDTKKLWREIKSKSLQVISDK